MADAQIPPQDIEVERAVLAECIDRSPGLQLAVTSGLEPEDFYYESHGLIYRALRKVLADGGEPDEIAVWAALEAMGIAVPKDAPPSAEGIRRLQVTELAGHSTLVGVQQKIDRLIELSRLRAKLKGAQLMQQAVYELDETKRADLMQEGMELIVADLTAANSPTKAAEIADEYVRYLTDPAPDEVFELPYHDLNRCILGGFRRKEVAVLGAWPEHGKSWLVDQMLTRWAAQGYRCVLFATEMDWLMRATRFTAAQTEIPMEKLLRKNLTADELAEAEAAVKKLPYDYHDAAGWNENMVAEQVILGAYDVAVIDVVNYLPEYVEKVAFAERICQRMLATAQRGNALVVLVSHFNRERDKGATKPRPVKRDLKQTSALEQIAGTILFLHRDETLSPDGEGVTIEPSGELFYAKTRTGMGGSIRVVQQPRTLTFEQEARPDQEEAAIAYGGATNNLPGFIGGGEAARSDSELPW